MIGIFSIDITIYLSGFHNLIISNNLNVNNMKKVLMFLSVVFITSCSDVNVKNTPLDVNVKNSQPIKVSLDGSNSNVKSGVNYFSELSLIFNPDLVVNIERTFVLTYTNAQFVRITTAKGLTYEFGRSDQLKEEDFVFMKGDKMVLVNIPQSANQAQRYAYYCGYYTD